MIDSARPFLLDLAHADKSCVFDYIPRDLPNPMHFYHIPHYSTHKNCFSEELAGIPSRAKRVVSVRLSELSDRKETVRDWG